MPATRAFGILLVAIVLLVVAVWINRATSGESGGYRLGQTDVCIPEAYAVPIPSTPPSDAHLYDESEGYDISASINPKEVGGKVNGYKEKVTGNDDTRFQGLYLSLSPISGESLEVDNSESFIKMESAPNLFIQDKEPVPLEPLKVLEKGSESYRKWGACTRMSFDDKPIRFECDRLYLRAGSLRIHYEIDQENLHLYKEVDQFIENKLSEWRCNS